MTRNEIIRQWRQERKAELAERSTQALKALAEAKSEIEYLESQVRRAEEGLPYESVGTINGVQAGTVFGVFAVADQLRELEALEEES